MLRTRRATSSARAAHDQGAAAVEFALVSVVFFTLLFGMIQYGLFFNDSLGVREGVREAARQGVVKTFANCGTAVTDLDKLRCTTKDRIGSVFGGTPYAAVNYTTWAKGQPLTVCAAVKEALLFGFAPLPNGGWVFSKDQLSIEQDTAPTGTRGEEPGRPLPAGVSWPTGCTG